MTQTNKRAVIYCRVSTREQVEEGNSLVTQEKNCRDYAIRNAYEIAYVFIEQGESAKTAQRTELQKLLTYCSNKKNGINAVIAYKLDRISRNTDDYSQLRIVLKRYGVEIKSTSENFENTPAGRFMENIIANVAQFDNDVRAERCVGGMREAMREGRYVWIAPVGYRNIKVGGKCTIAPDDVAPIVAATFKEIAANISPLNRIRKKVTAVGLVNKKGKPLSKTQFHRMIKNKVYTGEIIKFGEQHKGLFQPIISDELFDQVQRVLTYRRRQNTVYTTENPDFPLRRFLQHPDGALLTGSWSRGRRKKYPYYRFHFKDSKDSNYSKNELEDIFKLFLDKYKLTISQFNDLKGLVYKYFTKANEVRNRSSEQARQIINQLKTKQSQLISKNIQGVITDDLLQHQLAGIEQDLVKQGALLTGIPKTNVSYEAVLEFIKEYLVNPSKIWETSTFEDKADLQWFYFPEGITFNGVNCRTVEICNLFKAERLFEGQLLHGVDLPSHFWNTPEVGNVMAPGIPAKYKRKSKVPNEFYDPNPFINRTANEIMHLKNIKEGKVPKERTILEELGFGEISWN